MKHKRILTLTIIIVVFVSTSCISQQPGEATDSTDCADAKELVLMNGTILTMDSNDTIVSAVRIRDGRFVTVGDDIESADDSCVDVIDLDGRTVIPGLIDAHIHIVQPSQAPGHFLAAIETAFSIADLQSVLAERAATVPPGEFITALGSVGPVQFAENRWPTMAELDSAAPDHPIYFQQGFNGPAVTNTLGKAYFEERGISVDENGILASGGFAGFGGGGPPSAVGQALGALLIDETAEDAQRAAIEYIEYANSLGLTTVTDQGCCGWFGADVPPDYQVYGYETFLSLWQQDALNIRLRLEIGGGGSPNADGEYPFVLRTEDMMATVGEGDAMLKITGVGEFTVGSFGQTSGVPFVEAWSLAAENDWRLSQHSLSLAEHEAHLAAFEDVNAEIPIADLRWSLEHGFSITDDHLARLDAIGAGLTMMNTAFLPITPLTGSPPYRDIVDSGIHAGASSDSSNISPLNPWLNIYFMVTGKNVSGELVNEGQQITRLEALGLYTIESAWFSFDEAEQGSIEVGKLADLVVLSDDYLAISDEDIKHLSSLLTLIGGEVVYVNEGFIALD